MINKQNGQKFQYKLNENRSAGQGIGITSGSDGFSSLNRSAKLNTHCCQCVGSSRTYCVCVMIILTGNDGWRPVSSCSVLEPVQCSQCSVLE